MTGRVEAFRRAESALWDSIGASPTERFATLPAGGRIRVLELGDGPPVLFVHGANVAGSSWCTLAAALAGVRCLLVDRPGCGLSDPVPGGSLPDVPAVLGYTDDLVRDVLDALDLERAHIAATSYGGLFALRGAARHPDRVDRMVLYSWPMGAPADKVPMSMRVAALPGVRSLSARVPVTRGLVRSLLSQVGLRRAIDTGAFTEEMLDWTVSLLRETDTFRNERRASPTVVTPLKGLNRGLLLSDETLASVTTPCLFLWGEEDPNGGRAVAESFVSRLPEAELDIVTEAGHAPWIDQLGRCATSTAAFLCS